MRGLSSFECALLAGGLAIFAALPAAAEVNLYTTREQGLMQPLADAFTKSTGIKVNAIFLKDGLAERVAAEGASSPADLLMVADATQLMDLVNKRLTQPADSTVLEAAIPESLRGPEGDWYALSTRARVLYVRKDLNLTSFTYEQLADPAWKGKVCIRAGQHPYNIALLSAYIGHHGEAEAEKWLAGVHANLARKPAGGDREVARDIMGGLCDIGIANSYYVGLMRSGRGGPDQQKWGDAIRVVLPTFKDGGTHVNISGAAIAKHAPHKADAIRFLEFLVSDDAQKLYAEANYEYPVKAGAKIDPILAEFGTPKPDTMPIGKVVANRQAASKLVDKVGFDK